MTACDDCGDYTRYPEPCPSVSKDWMVCPHCAGKRKRVSNCGAEQPPYCADYIQVGPITPQPPSVTTIYIPPCPRCATLQAEVARLTALLAEKQERRCETCQYQTTRALYQYCNMLERTKDGYDISCRALGNFCGAWKARSV